jgi:hypothetical protein
MPQGGTGAVDGSSEEQPLVLNGVQAKDLECVLRVMFPRYPILTGLQDLHVDRFEKLPALCAKKTR